MGKPDPRALLKGMVSELRHPTASRATPLHSVALRALNAYRKKSDEKSTTLLTTSAWLADVFIFLVLMSIEQPQQEDSMDVPAPISDSERNESAGYDHHQESLRPKDREEQSGIRRRKGL